jgi:hypothetical protein
MEIVRVGCLISVQRYCCCDLGVCFVAVHCGHDSMKFFHLGVCLVTGHGGLSVDLEFSAIDSICYYLILNQACKR